MSNAGNPRERIVNSRGQSILVSAGAGSGKTTILVRRLMQYIINDRENIDKFVVITYTKAAAAELRGRISEEISKAIAAESRKSSSEILPHLRRQSALVGKAHIGTIHSFCTSVLREFSAAAGLRPGFKVVEEERAVAMKAAALDRVLEKRYSGPDDYPDFLELADTVGNGGDDRKLASLVLHTYDRLQSHPRPDLWMEDRKKELDKEWTAVSETEWGREIFENLGIQMKHYLAQCDELLKSMEGAEPEITKNLELVQQMEEGYRQFVAALDVPNGGCWEKAAAGFSLKLPRRKNMEKAQDQELAGRIIAARELFSDHYKKMEKIFSDSESKILQDMKKTVPAMKALLEVTDALGKEYAAAKRELSLVDFSDLEHFTADLLITPQGQNSDVARTLAKRFTEIMVDEYQDVSRVQDTIFHAISKDGKNLFFVGDLKQAIYRFRLADPKIFKEKFANWSHEEKTDEGEPVVIPLKENFRSRKSIIDAANTIFSACMSDRLGDIDYSDEAQRLVFGAKDKYTGAAPKPELIVIENPKADDSGDLPSGARLEASVIADRILEIKRRGDRIRDEEGTHEMRFSDVAVLLRTLKNTENIYRKVFAERGIPVSSGAEDNYYQSPEISQLTGMLSVIDNPHKDIPLLTVLRSPFFGFTPDDLAEIRSADKGADLYGALCAAAEANSRFQEFVDWLQTSREQAPELTVSELLWKIICEKDILPICAASADGETRKSRILRFVELAHSYEEAGYRGLHNFLIWLERMESRGNAPAATQPDSDGITIMSIHKSKGLQFPIVFLAGTEKQFNELDSREPVLMDMDLGLGPMCVDLERRVQYPTFARNAISGKMIRESRSEELRLLYVAVTRAMEQLYMVGTTKNAEKLKEEMGAMVSENGADPERLMDKNNMLAWLCAATKYDELISNRNGTASTILYSECRAEGYAEYVRKKEERGDNLPPENAVAECRRTLEESLAFTYRNAAATELPSKITATAIKGRREQADEETADLSPERSITPFSFRMPDFSGTEKPVTGAEKGTATHLVLQHINLERTGSEEEIRSEIQRLVTDRYLTEREAAAVDSRAVLAFYQSETGKRMKAARANREFRFSLLLPACEVLPTLCRDEILLQGVVDCYFEEEDGLVIVDYKTDRVRTEEELAAQAEHYTRQMMAYIRAMEKICRRPVKDCVLYFLAPGKEIHVLP